MNLEQNLANIKSEEYIKYLELYSNFHQERVKCLKRKNCDDKYIETPDDLKIVKGGKEKKIVKPKYIFVDERMKNINIELKELEQEIRNFRFIVESDSSKKIADAFADVKKNILKKQMKRMNYKNMLKE